MDTSITFKGGHIMDIIDTDTETKRKVAPHFEIVLMNETEYWCDDVKERAGRLWAAYLYDKNSVTYCCEMTPSYALYYLYTSPEKYLEEDEDARERLYEDMLQADESERVSYFHCSYIDGISLKRKCSMAANETIPGTEEEYEEMVNEELEYCRCNVQIEVPV